MKTKKNARVPHAGQRVRIKLEDGSKVWGRVKLVTALTEPLGVPGEMIPGRTTVTVTVELEL